MKPAEYFKARRDAQAKHARESSRDVREPPEEWRAFYAGFDAGVDYANREADKAGGE